MGTPPFKYIFPIFFRGRTEFESPITGTYSDGDDFLTFDNTAGGYVVGSHVFVSRQNNTIPEYLGTVTAATVTDITVEYQLSRGYSADTVEIWQPVNFWRPTWGIGESFGIVPELGTVTSFPSGGGAVNVQIAAAREQLNVDFRQIKLSTGDLNNWETFLFTDLAFATKRANFAFFDQNKNRSRFLTVLMNAPGNRAWQLNTGLTIGQFNEQFILVDEDSVLTTA